MAVFWEFAEYASDRLQGTHLNLGVEDTLHDLLMGMLGGLAFVVGAAVSSREAAK
jgi:hypothetical protein